MRFNFLIFLVIIFAACNETAISKKLSTADKLAISFINSRNDSVEKVVVTDDKNAINKMIGFLDNTSTQQYQCDYDGKMIFFEAGNNILEIDFQKEDISCRHFSFLLEGKIVTAKMSNEAADLLNSLQQGKGYY